MSRGRGGSLLGAAVLVATVIVVPLPTAAAATTAPDSSSPGVDESALIPMVEVDPADFVAEAAELPPELGAALERDAGITTAEWLAQAEASAVGVAVVDALAEQIDVRDARLEGFGLVVTVGTEADAAVVESVGATVEFGVAPDPFAEQEDELVPATDLRGGMPYLFNNNTARCSVGFVGIDSSSRQTQMMSAGHCEGDGALRRAPTITRPTISGGSFGEPLELIGDAALHVTDDYPNPGYPSARTTFYDLGMTPVTGPNWTPKPEVVTWGGGSSGAPLASDPLVIRDAGPALVGATLCKSGATTGWTCGTITDVDRVFLVGDSMACPADTPSYCVGGIGADICVRKGDSGGAAVVGSRAVGITSASNTALGACDASGDFGVFATLYSPDPALEQVRKLFPRWEPLVAVEPPTVTIEGSTLSGTLAHGGPRHTVDVVFSTGERRSAAVAVDGTWRVDASTTGVGVTTFSATARWGLASVSTPVTGSMYGMETARLFGSNRYETAVQVARAQFAGTATPTGPVTPGVPVVYLANGESFPDALSAGPAATLEGGPLLLTPATGLTDVVAAELDRLNPQRIVIVGGTGVVSSGVEAQAAVYATAASDRVVRLGGATRFETSRLIAQRMLSTGLAPRSGLWVATGADFPDALSAGAAAAQQRVPILLVPGSSASLDPATAAFIESTLQSTAVDIAGGTGVVSPGIESAIRNLASTTTVTRRGGIDRFATSLLINQAAYPSSASHAFLAYGFNFPDALAGSVLAALRGGPLYISETTCVGSGMVDHIMAIGVDTLTALGGPSVVGDAALALRRC